MVVPTARTPKLCHDFDVPVITRGKTFESGHLFSDQRVYRSGCGRKRPRPKCAECPAMIGPVTG
jgi:hypothetical protein